MLFKAAPLDEIVAGRITLAFRRWLRPTVGPVLRRLGESGQGLI